MVSLKLQKLMAGAARATQQLSMQLLVSQHPTYTPVWGVTGCGSMNGVYQWLPRGASC